MSAPFRRALIWVAVKLVRMAADAERSAASPAGEIEAQLLAWHGEVHAGEAEWLVPKHAAELLGIDEDSVQTICRRNGDACIRDGRRWLVRASWVAERAASRCRVVSG